MRLLRLLCIGLAAGCSTTGTAALVADSGGPDTTIADASSDAGASDAADESVEAAACPPYTTALLVPSPDCVFAGPCAFACAGGTASSYACNGKGPGATTLVDGSVLYPSAFSAPIDIVEPSGTVADQFPWEGGAYLSCAPIACVRWETGDHVDGGSSWPTDPCATEAGAPEQAWACPGAPGVVPPAAGCFNAGGANTIGGPGTGIPTNAIWCCPSDLDAAPPSEAGPEEASEPEAAAEASTDGGTEAATDASPDAAADATLDAGGAADAVASDAGPDAASE